MSNESIIQVPPNVGEPLVLQRFLLHLIERLDIILGKRASSTDEQYVAQRELLTLAEELARAIMLAQRKLDEAKLLLEQVIDNLRKDVEKEMKSLQEQIDALQIQVNDIQQQINVIVDERTRWMGPFLLGTEYLKRDQATEDGWLGIANTTTEEHLAPQSLGAPKYLIGSDIVWATQSSVNAVYAGIQVVPTKAMRISAVRMYAPTASSVTLSYQMLIVNVTDGTHKLDTLLMPANEWLTPIVHYELTVGKTFQAFLIASDTSASTTWQHNWNWLAKSNSVTPDSGEANTNQPSTLLRVNELDDTATDQSVDLDKVLPNTIIRVSNNADLTQYSEYLVVIINDAGAFREFEVVLVDTGVGGNVVAGDNVIIKATIPTPASTDYVENVGYFTANQPSNFATVQGVLQLGSSAPVISDNAYGADFKLEFLEPSDDWDLQGFTD